MRARGGSGGGACKSIEQLRKERMLREEMEHKRERAVLVGNVSLDVPGIDEVVSGKVVVDSANLVKFKTTVRILLYYNL